MVSSRPGATTTTAVATTTTATTSSTVTSTTNKPPSSSSNSLFQPFIKTQPRNNRTNIVITSADDTANQSRPSALQQQSSPRTRTDTSRSPQHIDSNHSPQHSGANRSPNLSNANRQSHHVDSNNSSRSPRHHISPGASPTTSHHEMFLSPSGSMSGASSGSNQSSQIIELPPLGADPETVSGQSDHRAATTRR